MKLWINYSDGFYLGATVIVAALTKEEAEHIVRKQLDDAGLPRDTLDVTEAPMEGVIYFDNGDY